MNDGRYKRFVFLIIFVIILLSVVIGLLFAILQKPKDVQIQYFPGKDGKDGQSIIGDSGVQGIAGVNGTNAGTIIQTVINNVPVPGEQGEKGLTGDPAPLNPQILIKVDQITCILSTQYEGDDLWTPLAQLPKPCTIESQDD